MTGRKPKHPPTIEPFLMGAGPRGSCFAGWLIFKQLKYTQEAWRQIGRQRGFGEFMRQPSTGLHRGWRRLFRLAVGLTGLTVALSAEARTILSPEQQEKLSKRGPISMCVDPDWMPFEKIDADGRHVGMAADYIRLFEQRLGQRIKLVPTTSWSDSLAAAQRRDCDILSMLNRTPERAQYLDFTAPYVHAPVVLITNRTVTGIDGLADMTGKTLGLVKGYVYDETLRRDHPDIDFRQIDSIDAGLLAVSRGELTAIVSSLYVATHRILELGIGNLRIAAQTPYENKFRVGVRNDSPFLVEVMRAAVDSLGPEDHISIRQKWHRIENASLEGGRGPSLTARQRSYLEARGPITMCTDPDWLPYEELDARGRHVGMAADYLTLMARRLGLSIALVKTDSWPESLEKARSRECDILSSLNDTPERRQYLKFSDPYIESPLVLVTRDNAPFIDNLKSVGYRTVSIPEGYAHGEFLRQDYPDIPVVDVQSVRDGLERVSRGEVFAHFGSLYVTVNEIQKAQLSNLKVNGHTEFRNRLAVGVRNDDPILLDIFNLAVRSITPEEHIQIRRKWTATTFEHAADYSLVWRIGGGIALVGLIFALWSWKLAVLNRRLKKEITLREAAQAELNRSNHELEQFGYAISHDLQEPLRMVTSYLQLLERKLDDQLDGNSREYLAFAADGAERMHRMIMDLLEFSRIGTQGGEMVPLPSRLALDTAAVNLQVALTETEAELEVGEMPQVLADENQLTRLLQNLIGNALKYRDPDRAPNIRIGAVPSGAFWKFTVADNGIGIAEGDFNRIFTVFQRLHTHDAYTGTGVGLAICKRIVERHGGAIWLDSQPGTGSRFHFTLPSANPPD